MLVSICLEAYTQNILANYLENQIKLFDMAGKLIDQGQLNKDTVFE